MKRILIIFSLMLVVVPASAQVAGTKSTTQMKLEQLRNEIAAEEQALAEAENEEKASQNRLSDLNRQLSLREELMRNYSIRVEQLKSERDSLQSSISDLNLDLNQVKKGYQSRAVHAYKYGRQHDAALILSASSINQMLVRINYLRRFTIKRRDQLQEIRQTARDLTNKRTEMQRKLVESEMLLINVDREQEKLDALRRDVGQELKRIQGEKESRTESLVEKRTMEQQLVELIQSYLTTNSRRASPATVNPIAPSMMTEAFSTAKGQLEWPAVGRVIEPFGDIVHPKYGTKTPNPGILIETGASSEVNSVFSGQVSTIDIFPDMGRFIIIEHGDYHTVYGNFSLIYVSKGDMVESGQLIGRAGTESEPRGEAVFFAVFKDGVPQNPGPWLRK
jgi:septal ring factor EnvC (AmiA/AmiB activator)